MPACEHPEGQPGASEFKTPWHQDKRTRNEVLGLRTCEESPVPTAEVLRGQGPLGQKGEFVGPPTHIRSVKAEKPEGTGRQVRIA